MAYPVVELAQPFEGQAAYASSDVHIEQVSDDVQGKSLRAFCQLGDDPSFKYWVPVFSGDDYKLDWTDADVIAAVEAFFV